MTPTELLSEELHISNGFHAIEGWHRARKADRRWKDDIVHEKLTGVASTSCRWIFRKYVLHYYATHAGL